MVDEAGFYFVQGNVAVQELFKRSGFAVGDAAGNDQVEVAKVGGNVEGEAVRSDPATDVNADSGKFLFGNIFWGLEPDAGLAWDAKCSDAEIGGSADHGFFERADIPVNVTADGIKIKDRVADDLAGAVIGDVAATVGFAELNILLTKDVLGGKEIFLACVAAEREDVGVLTKKEDVADGARFTRGDDALLKGVGIGPGEKAEVGGEEGRHSESY